MRWLLQQWPYATLFAAILLLILTPPLYALMGLPLALVFLQLPVYMLHQFEEHYHDRFRLFINANIAGGRDALTPLATFVINSVGVWGVDLVALYLARFVGVGWGVIAIYLPLINGLAHIANTLKTHRYNPGLVTSIVLFLPFCGWSLCVVSNHANWTQQAVGVIVAIVVHALILIHIKRRVRALNRG